MRYLDQYQQEAVDKITLFDRSVYLLTGAGGSGKTYTLQALLLEVWETSPDITPENTYLAASTGKAAKVMANALVELPLHNRPSTIHRMLSWKPAGFEYNAANPLDARLVILDEASMVDSCLMADVIAALTPDCTLILVGDVEQLPPVGAGAPFADLINHGDQGAVCRLLTNHRQAQGSLIADNCLRVLRGEKFLFGQPGQHSLGGALEDNMFFHEREDKEHIPGAVVDLCRPWEDAQEDYIVLAPQKTGVCGVQAINKIMQEYLNPYRSSKNEVQVKGVLLREQDKVLHTVNNYTLGVFNGYLGVIKAIVGDQIVVDYDGREVVYEQREHIEQLALGYCLSIHKSQGSQWKRGVLICHSSHYYMLSRNLLYTGVSRFRDELHVFGDHKALKRAISNCEQNSRNTYLKLKFAEQNKV